MKSIYFIGIGGVGMSAVAGLAATKGWKVKGSDVNEIYDPSRAVLIRYNIPYALGYSEKNISGCFEGKNPDLVVLSAAVTSENPEVIFALAKGIEVVSFPDALNLICKDLRQIVVTGTHGKSTTSGLISHALKALHDSSFMVGAVLVDYNANFYAGNGKDIVIEGDEYFASDIDHRPKFMLYQPQILLINNIEFDHPDAFASLEAVIEAFQKRVDTMPQHGVIVYNADDESVAKVISSATIRTIGFGFSKGDVRAKVPQLLESGLFEIAVRTSDEESFSIQSRFPGMNYAYDFLAAAATTLAAYPDTDINLLQEIFANYHGVQRRFQIISDGTSIEPVIIDDYAHHPTAVRQTLEAARMKYPKRRIVCFFEPHTYSRTKETLGDLASAFESADISYIAEVYPAREQRLDSSIRGKEVVQAIHKNTKNVSFVATKQQALEDYLKIADSNDVVLVMAVGDFNRLAYELRDALSTPSA